MVWSGQTVRLRGPIEAVVSSSVGEARIPYWECEVTVCQRCEAAGPVHGYWATLNSQDKTTQVAWASGRTFWLYSPDFLHGCVLQLLGAVCILGLWPSSHLKSTSLQSVSVSLLWGYL